MEYIIADIHGELNVLKKLISKLPDITQLYFVADLIDRGAKSRQVIKFIRKNNYNCVLGNHEQMMIDNGTIFLKMYSESFNINHIKNWLHNGGRATLLSYKLIEVIDNDIVCTKDSKYLEQFINDIEWLKTLPLYIEVESIKRNNKPIIVSHGSISDFWKKRDNIEFFKNKALYNKMFPEKNTEIYNVFGHKIIDEINLNLSYLAIDTGCFYNKYGNSRLSAYCINTNEIHSQKNKKNYNPK